MDSVWLPVRAPRHYVTSRDPSSTDIEDHSEDRDGAVEDPEEKAEDSEEKAEDPGGKAEDSEEKAEDPGEKAEDPEEKAEGSADMSSDSKESTDDSEDSLQEIESEPDPAAEVYSPGPMRWIAPVLVAVLGSAILVPGLASFGLWEPPDSWQVTIQRQTTKDGSVKRHMKGRFDLPRSELRVAEEARRAVVPAPKSQQRPGPGAASAGKQGPRRATDQGLPRRPPLTRALVSLGFRIFGVSEGAGRLPIALTGVLCLVCLFFGLRRLFGTWTGLLGAAVLLGLPAFVLHSRQLTSDIPTQLAGLLAVGGLGLAFAPLPRLQRLVWLVPGLMGLTLGFYARGAVIGVLLPVAAVLLAVGLSYRLFLTPGASVGGAASALRTSFWVQAGALLGLVVILTIIAAVVLASLSPPRYSAFLGETPIAATKVMSYHGVKTPSHQLAVFDVMIKQLGYAAFPWIALLPLGLAFLLYPRGGSAPTVPAAPPLGDVPARLARYGRLLLVSWMVVALLVSTYWLLRFGDLQYPALPAVAGVVAVLLMGLVQERPGHRRLVGLVTAVVVLAILFRDLLAFPEALVSSHINYQLRYPAEVSYKRFFYVFIIGPFGMLCLALLMGRGSESPVRWPATMREWFASSQLGIGRWFGLRLDDGAPSRNAVSGLTVSGILSGLVTVALLMAAGGGATWALMKRPDPGAVVLSIFAAPILLPLVPFFLATFLDLALFPFEVVWQVMSGRLWKGDLFLWNRDEIHGVLGLSQRFFAVHPVFMVMMAPSALVVALLYLLRLFCRALILLAVLVLLAPVAIFGAVRQARSGGGLPRVETVAMGALVCVPLLLSCYLGWSLIPRLSAHYSYKAIIDTYNHSHHAKRPEPLGLFKVKSRSPVFYTKGPLLSGGMLSRKYKRGRGGSTLLQYLKKGWTDDNGHHYDRVYAIVPVGELGKLDRDAHAGDQPVPYYVLDARNSFYVLLSNRLGKKRVGRKRVAERDLNPLRKMVMNAPPKLRCGRDENAQCVPLSVRIAERKGGTEPSLELIGAKFPKVVTQGSKFEVTLHFKVLKRIHGKYKVFLHIDGRGNRILGDHDPVGGKYQTSLWLPGRWVVDHYSVPASSSSTVSTPSGTYNVYAGLFQGDRRMEVLSGPQDGQNRIRLGRLRVGRKIGCGCGGR